MSESNSKIPALPFKLGGCSGRMIYDREGYNISDCDLMVNAEFILRACNCHDELLAACERVISRIPIGGIAVDVILEESDLKFIKAAIANSSPTSGIDGRMKKRKYVTTTVKGD